MSVFLDLGFRVTGDILPADHAYPLFSALSRIVPWLHSALHVAILPVTGTLAGKRLLKLNKTSTLRFRLPAPDIPRLLPLVGKVLDVSGHRLTLGTPEIHPLIPCPKLYSRLVIVRGALNPEAFMHSACRLLKVIAPSGKLIMPVRRRSRSLEGTSSAISRTGEPLRRTIRICNREIVGYAALVSGLSDEDSIRLQCEGLGGRRHFGCGVFVSVRPNGSNDESASFATSR